MASTLTAVTDRQSLSRLKVNDLKELCTNLSITVKSKHKKAELIELIVDKRRDEAENVAPSSSGSPMSATDFASVGYSLDPPVNVIPPVKFLQVFDHIVEKSGRNNKCLDRGVKHFDDGDVQELACKEVSDSIIWFRAKCVASQKKLKYSVYVSLEKQSGRCIDGNCDCPQGILGNCSHVCGLLLALEFIYRTKEQNPSDVSCTSRLCQWRKPRTVKVVPKPLSQISVHKPSYGRAAKKPKSAVGFDPRATEDRSEDPQHMKQHLKELMDIYPNTGMQLLWDLHYDNFAVEVEVDIEQNPLDALAEGLVIRPNDREDPLLVLTEDEARGHLKQQVISQELSAHIERMTRLQSLCPMWKSLHVGRLTSSVFGEVLSSSPKSANKSLVKRILEGSAMERLPWTVRWGKENEDRARQDYILAKERAGVPVTVTAAGLTISKDRSFLGASSDGHVLDPSQPDGMQEGALEVKCPCTVDGEDIRGMSFQSICTRFPNFLLEERNGLLLLKRGSKYFSQVQGEMAVLGVPWVDFVCWNPVDICIQRIYFDVDFWEAELYPKLEEFYICKILPRTVSL